MNCDEFYDELNPMLDRSNALFGVGLYTPTEAARLTNISAQRIRRWLAGYIVAGRSYEALWAPQVEIRGEIALGFRDLLEIRVVNSLINAGLSLQKIRRAIELSHDLTGAAHPLATSTFLTDGSSVFLQIRKEEGEDEIINIFTKQLQFRRIIQPSLKGVSYNTRGEPVRWEPVEGVILDPERSFGQPLEEVSGIPTIILAEAVATEGSIEEAAKAFLVSPSSVKRAAEFETKLAA